MLLTFSKCVRGEYTETCCEKRTSRAIWLQQRRAQCTMPKYNHPGVAVPSQTNTHTDASPQSPQAWEMMKRYNAKDTVFKHS